MPHRIGESTTQLPDELPAAPSPRVSAQPADRVEDFPATTATPQPTSTPATGSRDDGTQGAAWLAARGPDAASATKELDSLLGGFFVSDDDARKAAHTLAALSKKDYQKVYSHLERRGLDTLVEHLPTDARASFLDAAVSHGVLSEHRGRQASPNGFGLVAPPQPDIIHNEEALPDSLRTLIHRENASRAANYTQAFNRYVDAYCDLASHAESPLELRELGPLSTPPALSEPGITQHDVKRGLHYAVADVNLGIERAAIAVSNRISDFRGERHAGSYALDLGGGFRAHGYGGAVGAEARGTLDGAGHLQGHHHEEAGLAAFAHGRGGVEVTANKDGEPGVVLEAGEWGAKTGLQGLSAVGAEYADGRTTLSATATGSPIGGYSFVDEKQAQYGGGLEARHALHGPGGIDAEVWVRVGVSAQGIPREYYQDIGSTKNEGVFGKMAELDARTPWNRIPRERQQELARQGFTEKFWPF